MSAEDKKRSFCAQSRFFLLQEMWGKASRDEIEILVRFDNTSANCVLHT